jgi:hypothetical protein
LLWREGWAYRREKTNVTPWHPGQKTKAVYHIAVSACDVILGSVG